MIINSGITSVLREQKYTEIDSQQSPWPITCNRWWFSLVFQVSRWIIYHCICSIWIPHLNLNACVFWCVNTSVCVFKMFFSMPLKIKQIFVPFICHAIQKCERNEIFELCWRLPYYHIIRHLSKWYIHCYKSHINKSLPPRFWLFS